MNEMSKKKIIFLQMLCEYTYGGKKGQREKHEDGGIERDSLGNDWLLC